MFHSLKCNVCGNVNDSCNKCRVAALSPVIEQNIIIFCGPDGCGKTNISAKMSEITNIPVYKSKVEAQAFLEKNTTTKPQLFLGQLRFAQPQFVDFLEQSRWSVIFDRWWPCEWVYAEHYDRKTDHDILRSLDEKYSKLNTTIVMCYRSSYDKVEDDLDSNLTGETLRQIEGRYREIMRSSKCRWIDINVDSENTTEQVYEILDRMKNE